jgi:cupin 2 domain-containing protein
VQQVEGFRHRSTRFYGAHGDEQDYRFEPRQVQQRGLHLFFRRRRDSLPKAADHGRGPASTPRARAGNLLAEIPSSLFEELIQPILTRPGLRIERIVSQGHASPEGFWYDQDQHKFVVLLQGAARLLFVDGMVEMKPGLFIEI